MIETHAIIIRVEGNEALVESVQSGGCGNCDKNNGCGSGKLAQLFNLKPRRFRVRNETNAQVGAMVRVTLAEGVLLHSALLMYVLPLVLLLFGAFAGQMWANDASSTDAYSAIGGLFGLAIGFAIVKNLSRRQQLLSVAQPVIL